MLWDIYDFLIPSGIHCTSRYSSGLPFLVIVIDIISTKGKNGIAGSRIHRAR
jgi:hypothetical protein